MRAVFCRFVVLAAFAAAVLSPAGAQLQFPSADSAQQAPNPLTDTTVEPGKIILFDLEARFAKDVAAHGGAGFAS